MTEAQTLSGLVAQMLSGDRRALARLLSFVEQQDEQAFEILSRLPSKPLAYSAGITGPAGAGKSSLVDQLIRQAREHAQRVGVIAVDPSSPFTGGAVLGDRVRMQRHFQDPDVFIRSVGSRGRTGGLSFATRALMRVLSAFGADTLLIETVGAGQSETDVANLVDTTMVVLTPEGGDSIQALKAGMLEIADIYIVNKKDREGADSVVHDIKAMIGMGQLKNNWEPPIIMTEGRSGEGVAALWEAMQRHRNHLASQGRDALEVARRRQVELREWVMQQLGLKLDRVLKQTPSDLETPISDQGRAVLGQVKQLIS